jgi:hypothetical protein
MFLERQCCRHVYPIPTSIIQQAVSKLCVTSVQNQWTGCGVLEDSNPNSHKLWDLQFTLVTDYVMV